MKERQREKPENNIQANSYHKKEVEKKYLKKISEKFYK